MKISTQLVRRPLIALSALALVAGSAAPFLLNGVASAGQFSNRSIQLSDSAPSGGSITSGVGSGTNVQYKITFTPTGTTAIGGIVVDICDNTPLIGDTTCTAPAGFNWGASPSATIDTGLTDGNWTESSAVGDGSGTYPVLKFSHATDEATSGPIEITVTGVTNPSTALTNNTHSFYARILTFDSAANMNSLYPTTDATRGTYTALSANMIDYGGVALAVTAPITITARVMETMSLCTSADAFSGTACAGATSPAVIIGHLPNWTLDDSESNSASIYSQVSTNAASGYGIFLRGANACGGLSKDGGTTCDIPAVAAGDAVGTPIAPGTAAFGLLVGSGTPASGGTGTNTAESKWDGPNYVMDTTTANDNINYVYGSKVIDSTGQANSVNNTFTFRATASPTTPAGIYTQHFSLIAAGRF